MAGREMCVSLQASEGQEVGRKTSWGGRECPSTLTRADAALMAGRDKAVLCVATLSGLHHRVHSEQLCSPATKTRVKALFTLRYNGNKKIQFNSGQ